MRGVSQLDMASYPYIHRLYVPKTPTTYTLELTSHCNNACVGCGNVFARDLGEMPLEQWTALLDMLQPHVVNIRVTGGEPTLHPQFSQIILAIDRLAVPFVLFTNGVWRNRQKIIRVLLDCRNLDGVLISLHGKDNASHRQFVGQDSFEETVKSIREATRAGLLVNTNTVLTCANFRDVEVIAQLSLGLGASFVAFSRYYGAPIPITALSEAELLEAVESVHTLKAQGLPVRFNNNVPACFSGHPSKSCPAGITHCTVDPLGNVRPCNHVPVTFGNLFECSIEELWRSEKARWWRGLIPQACYQCAEFDSCRGGCKAMALKLDKKRDPLMRAPLVSKLRHHVPRRLTLYEKAIPLKNFVMRREEFGLLLVNRSRVLPVDAIAEPLLDMLDGTHSLRAIEQQFGQVGLNFVGILYQEGLVRMASPNLPSLLLGAHACQAQASQQESLTPADAG
jgi:radical SAM protein with 4Fe4S-binding SPASM domain